MAAINQENVKVALSRVQGTQFELFAAEFFASILGTSFVPLGGVKDGGADGYIDTCKELQDKPTAYYQASVQENHDGKIKGTIARLQEYGRTPEFLYYVTSRVIKDIDKVQMALQVELSVFVTIRDGTFITVNINKSRQTQAAFNNHLKPLKVI